MGTVYHAELNASGGFVRPCAVKVMKSTQGPDHDHFMARMRDEARLLGMLQDEQILGVSEMVTVEHRDAVIMDYVEGVDLSDLVRGGRVPPRALCEMGAEIAGTLHRAHEAKHPQTGEPLNVIHRDIKPANIMITMRGNVRLLDFGVARAVFSNRESQTQGLVLGTLNYFPPEILAGSDPTKAVDFYGLGLALWECATGKEWGTPQAQQQRFEKRVEQRLGEVGAEYKPILPILKQLLAWDPTKRPTGSAAEAQLLKAADQCSGEGLRTWSRDVVGRIVAERERAARDKRDELVGRTFQIGESGVDASKSPAPAPRSATSTRGTPAKAAAPRSVATPKPRPASGGGMFAFAAASVILVSLGVIVFAAAIVVAIVLVTSAG